MKAMPLIVRVWRQPGLLEGMTVRDWDLLLRQADGADLGAALYYLVAAHGTAAPPLPVRDRLEWARVLAERQVQAVRCEVDRIGLALAATGVPLILLKGAAYTMAGLDCGQGRLYSDVDILVPKEKIGEVEVALMTHGWGINGYDAYDQRYYRQWMHELPPMQHRRRDTTIDVHHAILPQTARVHPDADKLRAAAVAITGAESLYMLAPVDLVLHSAVHLFYGEEFRHGLRDLIDLHRLLLQLGEADDFWSCLARRAEQLELQRPLYYALRYCSMLMGTPVPAAWPGLPAPPALLVWWMDRLFLRALLPMHASCRRRGDAVARFLLYVRGHWLRMPPLMLARHLAHKAFVTPKAAK